jgi:hypothetical protein
MQKLDKKYLERWANTYSLMQTVPNDKRFSIDMYGKAANTPCGTTACIVGHAALHPWFRRRGLIPEFDDLYTMNVTKDQAVFGLRSYMGWHSCPFDPSGAYLLLGYKHCDTPKQAARAIKIYMEKHWTKAEVKEAIANAVVEYNADYVHKYTPWQCEVTE